MSALDRAIIKAFHRLSSAAEKAANTLAGAPQAAAPRGAAGSATRSSVPLSQALADLNVGQESPPVEEPPAAETRSPAISAPFAVATDPISTSIGALLDEALQPELPQSPIPSDVLAKALVATAPKLPAVAATTATTRTPIAPPPAQNVTTGSAAVANAWHPLLQVDRVVWPSIHNRLQSTAQAAIEQMTDGLQTIGDSGRRIIGLTSCASGEGVTTLLSAAARELLGRGRKVALVDGNWGNPQLARCLGLLPQIGWEDSLSGGLPLEEVVIESLADGLAVLPVREPPASAITKAAIVVGLEILAREFDFVLVDLGPLDDIEDGTPARDVTSRMDAVVLVQNVRVTPPNRLTEVQERLAASNLRYAGTIQNFVAS